MAASTALQHPSDLSCNSSEPNHVLPPALNTRNTMLMVLPYGWLGEGRPLLEGSCLTRTLLGEADCISLPGHVRMLNTPEPLA